MSDLSEQIETFIKKAQKEHGQDGQLDIQVETTKIPETPGFEAMKNHYDEGAAAVVRRVYRQFAGGPVFDKPLEAYEKTSDLVTAAAQPLLFSAISDGIQMGQGTSYIYKKYRMFKRLDEVFDLSKWREESAIIGLRFEMDEDTVTMFHNMLEQVCLHLGGAAGYARGMQHINKIWDMWYMAVQSLIMSLYYCGYTLGKQWQEESELAGILAATDQKDEEAS